MTVQFFMTGLPPSPNTSRRLHWHQRSDEANVWKDAAMLSLHEATGGRWSPIAVADVELVLVAATARRRDPDNVVASCKPVLDALVLAGLLPDDSYRVIRSLTTRMERGPVTGVRVLVRPVTPGSEGETR